MKHASLRGAIVSALLGVTGLGVFLSGNEACATRECLGSPTLNYTSGGDLPDPNTWESTPIDGNWLHFQPVTNVYIEIPEFANREVLTTTAYISGVYNPNKVPVGPNAVTNNYAEASGNLAEFVQIHTVPSILNAQEQVLALTVYNGTCAEYYVRIVVTAAPAEAGSGDAGDAGDDSGADADTDTGVTDADSGDASLD